jgi:hypothetical protein
VTEDYAPLIVAVMTAGDNDDAQVVVDLVNSLDLDDLRRAFLYCVGMLSSASRQLFAAHNGGDHTGWLQNLAFYIAGGE